MKFLPIFAFLCYLVIQPIYPKIALAFLGVKSEEEPLLSSELHRQIIKEFRTLPEYTLKPEYDVDMLFKRGILVSPEVPVKRSSIIAKKLDTRILTFGTLNRMELEYSRAWYKPWSGSVILSHSMWFKIIDASDGSVKYSGKLKVNNTVKDKYLGWEPSIGKLDPVFRDGQLNILISSLAKKTRVMLLASIKGLEEEIPQEEKVYDPEFFNKLRLEKKQKEGASLKSRENVRKLPKKDKPVYTKSLFKPKKTKKKEKAGLKDVELKAQDIEMIEGDIDLMNDVNLMEGM